MKVSIDFINDMAKPVFVVEFDGSIVQINPHGHLLLNKLLHKNNIDTIYEIEPDFDLCTDFEKTRKTIYLKKLKLNIDVYVSTYDSDKKVLIYIFDNILFNEEINNIFNSMGYAIAILNAEGVIETVNNALYLQTGLTREETEPGNCLKEHYKNKTTCITEPTYFDIIREKKSVVKRTSYKTGITLLFKGTPIFEKNGEIKRIITIGQNVSDNSALDEMLILSQKSNSISTAIVINEINEYFSNENFVITSDIMKKTVNTAIKVANSDSSVFIWGESGVGKEMIAKIIHYSSKRKNNPFVTINCAAIPKELFESELFGYEQGAFTGASKFGKKGLLEEANGGTVFLDELGELPYAMQSKLLRAIQENKIRKVGGNSNIPIDVRYVSATNLKIEQILDNNVFRNDLYYRLSVIPINIPPLRQRRDDIIPLISHFLYYYNEQQGKTVVLSKKALRKLINYDWPGNIRELKNIIERNVLLADNDLIDDVEMSDTIIINKDNLLDEDRNSENIIICNTIPIPEAYDIVFKHLVKKVYEENGSIVKTASILEIDPSTIHRKIKKGELSL